MARSEALWEKAAEAVEMYETTHGLTDDQREKLTRVIYTCITSAVLDAKRQAVIQLRNEIGAATDRTVQAIQSL